MEPAFASTFTVLPERLSKAFLLSTVATMFRGFRLQAFRHGNGALTQALASRVAVRLSTQVDRVEAASGRVTVRLRDGSDIGADAAVLAVPGNAVGGLCSALTPTETEFFRAVRYAASIVVFVMAGAAAEPGFYGAGIPRKEGIRLYGMAVDNTKAGVAPPDKTLFNCAFSEEAAAELMNAPDDDVITALKGELSRLPLHGLETVEGYVVHRWPALVPQFYPGYHRSLVKFLSRRDRTPGLFFAGDYLVGPYTEAALTSGLRAAQECADRFGR